MRVTSRHHALIATVCVLFGSAGIQVSAALAEGLFGRLPISAVSGFRMTVAAAVLLLLTRPQLRGRSRSAWLGIVLYGVAMAAMNVLFYHAVQRIPLGVAVTLEFCGPLAVAAVGARGAQRLLPVLTLVGVALVAGPQGDLDPVGVLAGLGAAAAFGGYTVLAGRVGDDDSGLGGLALSVTVGAVLLAPFSVPSVPAVQGGDLLPLIASGLLGVAMAFSLDFVAVRLTSPRVAGTLFAIDPVMGALVGATLLGDRLTGWMLAGIVLVVASGAAVIWLSGRAPGPVAPDGEVGERGIVLR
ncbi:EamA family transporter [Cellulomonas sp. RIT-PI-Y]|uniref:EamA family transporter n=1 Tax=Cellulomonas sp. RIT-PI-Y TaxID=3035297 RepID=UPI0021D81EEB|nr:EamA family transporter [Cellulomonas sp. RIT-PI-Y]